MRGTGTTGGKGVTVSNQADLEKYAQVEELPQLLEKYAGPQENIGTGEGP